MSFLDLNNEEEQQERNYGPVPAGSRVLCRITLEKPQYCAPDDPYISRSQKGLLGLWAKIEVVTGTYAGVYWYDNIWLPVGRQKISLADNQKVACRMGGARIKAIVEANRGISPKDDSPKANRARQVDTLDLNGMEFPARLGINKESYTGKDGKTYWSNTIGAILLPDKAEYQTIRNGGEIITDGPVVGKETAGQQGQAQGSGDFYGQEMPPTEAYELDSVPF